MGVAATLAERDERFARLRAAMAEHELDALVIGGKGHWWTGRGYVRYLSDFHLWGHDAMLVFPALGEPALTLTSPAVAAMAGQRGWIEDVGGDVMLVPRTLAALGARGLKRARIGTVGTRAIIGADMLRELEQGLPGAQLVPADDLVDAVRARKSPLEVEQNRALWALACRCMERFAEVVADGASERELAAETLRVAFAGGARDVLVLLGDRPTRYAPPEGRALRCDDLVRYHMELCGESGHWCELTLTLAYRGVRDDEARLMEAELAAMEAVRLAARPGVRLADLSRRYEQVLADAGYELGPPTRHFDLHGQGMDVIERPWYAAEQPWGSAGDAPLGAGAILSYHPRRDVRPAVAWSTGISDDLLVADDGGSWLSGDWHHTWREASA